MPEIYSPQYTGAVMTAHWTAQLKQHSIPGCLHLSSFSQYQDLGCPSADEFHPKTLRRAPSMCVGVCVGVCVHESESQLCLCNRVKHLTVITEAEQQSRVSQLLLPALSYSYLN